jgi:hypothetical protein
MPAGSNNNQVLLHALLSGIQEWMIAIGWTLR